MQRPSKIALLTLALCLLLAQAFRDSSATLTFVNVGPGNLAPGGVYAYPYNVSINGSSTLTPTMCDAYTNHIQFGETWTADVAPHSPRWNVRTGGQALLDYKAAGVFFMGALTSR